MKILFATVTLPYFPGGDGGQSRVFHIIKNMAKNHDVTLVSIVDDRTKPMIHLPGEFCNIYTTELKTEKKKENKKNRWFLRLAAIYRLIFYRSRLLDTAYDQYAALHQAIQNNLDIQDFDVLYVEQPATPVFKYFKSYEEYDTHLIADINMSLVIHFNQKFKARKLDTVKYQLFRDLLLMRKLERTIYNHADLVITDSMKEETYLKKFAPNINLKYLPNGVNLNYFKPNPQKPSDRINILMTGNYHFSPNTDGAFYFYNEIFPAIKKAVPRAHFIIAGKRPPDRLIKLGKEDDSVTVTGFVDDMRDYFNISHIFINPLRIGGGARTKILEAFAMKLPVVSTTIGVGHGYDLEDGRHIHIADTKQSFIDKTIALIKDKSKRESMINEAYELVSSEYSWEALSARFEKAVLSIIEQHNKNK